MKLKAKPLSLTAKGYYSICVKDKNGNNVEEKCSKTPTQNVVTYLGARKLFVTDEFEGPTCNASVGTGTAEITRSSSNLGNRIENGTGPNRSLSRRNTSQVDNGDGTSTNTYTTNYSFDLGQFSATISEVGLYEAGPGGELFAGQLIKDEFGDPTTITILSDEQLIVTYTIETTVPNVVTSGGTGTVDADGVTTNYEIFFQPFFKFPDITSDVPNTRYSLEEGDDEISFLGSDGQTVVADLGASGLSWSWTDNLDGTGTYTTGLRSFTPSDFNTTDLAWLELFNGASSAYGITNTSTGAAETGGGALTVNFSPSITKTSSQALSFEITFDVTY